MAQVLVTQFDVYKNPRAGLYPLLLDGQTDVLSALGSRVGVPLVPLEKYLLRFRQAPWCGESIRCSTGGPS